MVRPLHPALLAAQRKGGGIPYITLTLRRREGGVERPSLSLWHQNPSGPQGPHAATSPGDGSLARATVAGGQLLYQRVPSPGPQSDYSLWTSLGPAQSAVALASNGAKVLLAYVESGTVKVRESTNYGASWGSPVAIASISASYLAAAYGSADEAAVFLATSSQLMVVKRSRGVWGSLTSWPHTLASITGLACHYLGDYNLLVTGVDPQGKRGVWAVVLGDGYRWPEGSWSPRQEIQMADAESQVFFSLPSLAWSQVYRLAFLESFSGVVPYSRVYLSYIPLASEFADGLWREPLPTPLQGAMVLVGGPQGIWLSSPRALWHAPIPGPIMEAGDRLLELEVRERPLDGRMRIVLEDGDGSLAASGLLVPGTEIDIGLGYHTSQGPKTSHMPSHWIEAVEWRREGGRRWANVQARPLWGLLEAFRARRQYSWNPGEKNIFSLLAYVMGRAGIPFSSLSYSATAVNRRPAFAIHPGQPALESARSLLAMVPDVVVPSGPYAYLKDPTAPETPCYQFGREHPIIAVRRVIDSAQANRIQIWGAGVIVEGFFWESVDQVGDRLVQIRDLGIASPEGAQQRLEAELWRLQKAIRGVIEVPVNCGQELYDVVELVGAPELGPGPFRVMEIETIFRAGGGRYFQRLALAAP